jgi:hypothetical protein
MRMGAAPDLVESTSEVEAKATLSRKVDSGVSSSSNIDADEIDSDSVDALEFETLSEPHALEGCDPTGHVQQEADEPESGSADLLVQVLVLFKDGLARYAAGSPRISERNEFRSYWNTAGVGLPVLATNLSSMYEAHAGRVLDASLTLPWESGRLRCVLLALRRVANIAVFALANGETNVSCLCHNLVRFEIDSSSAETMVDYLTSRMTYSEADLVKDLGESYRMLLYG